MPRLSSIISRLAAISAIVIIGAAGAGYYLWLRPTEIFSPPRIVKIERGERFQQVARDLSEAGVVRSELALRLYAGFNGTARQVKPGEYAFSGGERVADVMRHLVRGDFNVVTVTIPEGLTLHQIAEKIGAAGLVCPDDFERAARSGPIVQALGLTPPGAEGYLFPATYHFAPHATADEILFAMLAKFSEILTPERQERMFALGLSPREAITMASIIEKEAHVPGERPVIAGVFYNRLRLKMPLQSDPTAEYDLADETIRPAEAVRTPSPFNTYQIAGLPPGPIANPGLKSIEAALYPTDTNALYFVARDDGTHIFSRTFSEHKRAIAGHAPVAESPVPTDAGGKK